jgi:carbonic anhydrase
MIPADEALERLRDGNRRFVAELGRNDELSSESRRRSLATRQQPFAIILGCSDSRVPAELIFDQGLGDLFVIRVAGNIVAPSQIDSVEFSAVLHNVRAWWWFSGTPSAARSCRPSKRLQTPEQTTRHASCVP